LLYKTVYSVSGKVLYKAKMVYKKASFNPEAKYCCCRQRRLVSSRQVMLYVAVLRSKQGISRQVARRRIRRRRRAELMSVMLLLGVGAMAATRKPETNGREREQHMQTHEQRQ